VRLRKNVLDQQIRGRLRKNTSRPPA